MNTMHWNAKVWMMDSEEELGVVWRTLDGYYGYEVSNYGEIRTTIDRHHGKKTLTKNCILTKNLSYNGYYRVHLRISPEKQKIVLVHRLVAISFIPNPKNKPQINHKNGDKMDNRVCNLEWVTARENKIHAVENGLQEFRTREEAFNAKHSNETIKEILSCYYDKFLLCSEIAKIFPNIHKVYIENIVSGRARKIDFEEFINSNPAKYAVIMEIISRRKPKTANKIKEELIDAVQKMA